MPCYFSNAGDNHAECCIKVLRADTRRACYSSYVGAAATVGGGVQCCPFRVCTAHAAGRVIRDCLAASRRCRYLACRRRLAAARHCRYAVCHSHLATTTAAVVVEPPAAVCALAQRSRAAAARTDWYAARRCRYSACRRRLAAARHCRYAACHSYLAATTAAVVVEPSTAVCALA